MDPDSKSEISSPAWCACQARTVNRQRGSEAASESGTAWAAAAAAAEVFTVGTAAVDHRRDLAVGVRLHELGAELGAVADVDRVGIVRRRRDAKLLQLLEQDADLPAVRGREAVELEVSGATRGTGAGLVAGARRRRVDGGLGPRRKKVSTKPKAERSRWA